MALNPQYEDIGKGFVQQYYAMFDDPARRGDLVHLFNVSTILPHLFLPNRPTELRQLEYISTRHRMNCLECAKNRRYVVLT